MNFTVLLGTNNAEKVGNTSLVYWKIVLLVLLISVYSDGDINILIFHLKKKKKIEKIYAYPRDF